MATKAALSEAEYLRTSFPGVDLEYRQGELVERSVPDLFHSEIQRNLCMWFGLRMETHRVYPFPELRNFVRAGRYMIPDVCVFWPDAPSIAVPERRPLIAIEILSPDDLMSEVLDKLNEYKEWGVVHVWLVDPRRKKLYVFQDGLRDLPALPIPEAGIEMSAAEIFS